MEAQKRSAGRSGCLLSGAGRQQHLGRVVVHRSTNNLCITFRVELAAAVAPPEGGRRLPGCVRLLSPPRRVQEADPAEALVLRAAY